MNGIFCANFATPRGCWEACNSAWCSECYTPHDKDCFRAAIKEDSSGFEWNSKRDKLMYKKRRDGDHLHVTMHCDLRVFRNLTFRNPIETSEVDELLLCCIRRVNLDAFWSRASKTVGATKRDVGTMLRLWESVGIVPTFQALGPFPVGDTLGYGLAIAMVLKSLEPGAYNSNYQQFETIRRLRCGFSNTYAASLQCFENMHSLGMDKSKIHLSKCPSQSLWFEKFALGCSLRMGAEVHSDKAVSLPLVHAFFSLIEQEWKGAESLPERSKLASIGAYVAVAFCGSFRGPEVFLVDLFGLRQYLQTPMFEESLNNIEYVVVPLLGTFKGETGIQYHLTPMVARTGSGSEVKRWLLRLIGVCEEAGITHGPAFCDSFGNVAKTEVYENAILERFCVIQRQSSLIPKDVNVYEDFGVSRSFRRGSTSEARVRGVTDRDVDFINRWRNHENAKGRKPRRSMRDHYSDIEILVPGLLRYSMAL